MSESQLRQLSVLAGEKLKADGRWITCAESCTGGGIAKAITDIAGSSAYFDRGFVTYSNAAKHDLLGVAEATLTAHGAVSEAVVREMAVGALHAAKADLALSVSGIAGPEGGSAEKPVGTVWFASPTVPAGCWRARCSLPAIAMRCGFRRRFSRCRPPLRNFCKISLDTV